MNVCEILYIIQRYIDVLIIIKIVIFFVHNIMNESEIFEYFVCIFEIKYI